jgi:hypothetical protein
MLSGSNDEIPIPRLSPALLLSRAMLMMRFVFHVQHLLSLPPAPPLRKLPYMLNRLATMVDALPGVVNIDLLLHPRGLELSMSKMWIWRCLDYLRLFFFLVGCR